MSKRVVLVSVLLLGLVGCGGLLYTAKSLDSNDKTVFLTDGMSVSVSVSAPENVLSKKIRNEFRAQLSKKNVNVTDDAGNSMVVEIDRYENWHRKRLSVRPGITGPWQLTDRLSTDFDERIRLDLNYIETQTFLKDLIIFYLNENSSIL